jgi:Tol biopolymer transport system component
LTRTLRVPLLSAAALLASSCAFIVRASVDTAGGDSEGSSSDVSISGDGRYVAFASSASDLVTGPFGSIFVRDLRTGTTRAVDLNVTGGAPDGPAQGASISRDGRYVAFYSSADNLVDGDTNLDFDVFVRDLQTGTTTRASVDPTGADAGGGSYTPSISGDGRYVAFQSTAGNLVPGDTNFFDDVFVRDLQTGTTRRVSVDTGGGNPNLDADNASISGDGRYVAFRSLANDLVPGDTGGLFDVFVRDLQTGTTTRASVDRSGGSANADTTIGRLSADGRYITFASAASDLVSGDTNGLADVFVRDLQTGTTTRASVDRSGGNANDESYVGSVSAGGRYVAFGSAARDLVDDDTNDVPDVFVRDRRSATTTRLSVDTLGREAHGESRAAAISADGRYVAFSSKAKDLVAGDTTGGGEEAPTDVFVRAVVTPTVDEVTPATLARGSTTTLTVTGTGFFSGAKLSTTAFGPAGVVVRSVTLISETELRASVTVASDAPTGTRTVLVFNPGTGPGALATGFGLCGGCLTVT